MRRLAAPLSLVALYVLAVGLGGYLLLPRLPFFGPDQEAAAWQTWAVIIGGAVVLWYTWETAALRRATERQIHLQLRPFVVFDPVRHTVTNVGKGAAVNVGLDDVVISKEFEWDCRFPYSVPVLEPAETKPIEVVGPNGPGDASALNPMDPRFKPTITIRYDDVEMNRYVVTEEIESRADESEPRRLRITGFRQE